MAQSFVILGNLYFFEMKQFFLQQRGFIYSSFQKEIPKLFDMIGKIFILHKKLKSI